MVLRVINVPAPAKGAEWRYTIPAQWLVKVVSVSATLVTSTNPTSSPDSSGNALDLVCDNTIGSLTWGAPGPYAGGANNVSVANVQGSTMQSKAIGASPSTNLVTLGNITVMALTNVALAPQPADSPIAAFLLAGGVSRWAWYYSVFGGNPTNARHLVGFSQDGTVTGIQSRNAWHHVAFVWNGANWLTYVDGALFSTDAFGAPSGASPGQIYVGGSSGFGQGMWGSIAGVAVFNSALAAGTIASIAGSTGSNAAYKAAALAASPVALYMLDTLAAGGSRTATLEITDGTTAVGDYPGGTITGTGNQFQWTWATSAAGVTQSADASISLVQIPPVTLPGGYTIGSSTPGLLFGDQWQNVAIWWDDGELGPAGPVGPYEYPPGAFLEYHQRQGTT